MSRRCTMLGKRRNKANHVSHANNRTRKWQMPNLHTKRIFDPVTGKWVRVKLSTRAMKTISRAGLPSKLQPKS
jgi:large subunit ribosomal protein L28